MKEDSKKSVNQFTVTKFSDICDKIIPFLEKYPLLFSPLPPCPLSPHHSPLTPTCGGRRAASQGGFFVGGGGVNSDPPLTQC